MLNELLGVLGRGHKDDDCVAIKNRLDELRKKHKLSMDRCERLLATDKVSRETTKFTVPF